MNVNMQLKLMVSNVFDEVYQVVPYSKNDITGKVSVATDIVMEEVKIGVLTPPNYGMLVREEFLQEFMNDLWKAGFRPKKVGQIESISSKDDNLVDLRKVNDKLFKILYKLTDTGIE